MINLLSKWGTCLQQLCTFSRTDTAFWILSRIGTPCWLGNNTLVLTSPNCDITGLITVKMEIQFGHELVHLLLAKLRHSLPHSNTVFDISCRVCGNFASMETSPLSVWSLSAFWMTLTGLSNLSNSTGLFEIVLVWSGASRPQYIHILLHGRTARVDSSDKLGTLDRWKVASWKLANMRQVKDDNPAKNQKTLDAGFNLVQPCLAKMLWVDKSKSKSNFLKFIQCRWRCQQQQS